MKKYKKLYPQIDTSKGFFSEQDYVIILKDELKDYNFESPLFLSYLSKLDKKIKHKNQILKDFKNIVYPDIPAIKTKFSIEYWIRKGWDISYAKNKVSELQRKNSKRCIEYWNKLGYSEEQSIEEVKKYQAESGKKAQQKLKDLGRSPSCWTKQFWIERGYSDEGAKDMIKQYQRNNALKNTLENIKLNNPVCIEYHKKRFPDNYQESYENYLKDRFSKMRYNSKIADEFCQKLAENFKTNELYFSENEYGKYIPNVGYRKYDYIDLTEKICIEFNGDYWHKHSEDSDKIKKDFIINCGFRYFSVSESEYRNNKEKTISTIIERIKNEKNC